MQANLAQTIENLRTERGKVYEDIYKLRGTNADNEQLINHLTQQLDKLSGEVTELRATNEELATSRQNLQDNSAAPFITNQENLVMQANLTQTIENIRNENANLIDRLNKSKNR